MTGEPDTWEPPARMSVPEIEATVGWDQKRYYGYDFAELSNNSFIKSEFNFRYRLAENHYASFIANYARLEGNVFRNLDLFQNIKSGYALGYSFNSFIGPVELKYSWSPETQQQYWLFNLGFWF